MAPIGQRVTTLPWLKVTMAWKRGTCCCRMSVGQDAHDRWSETQREDPVLDAVLNWLETQKKTDLKTLLGEHASSEEGQLIWRNCQNCMIHKKALYLC